jgi:hypothetical protein
MATIDLRTIYLKQLDLPGSTMGDRSDFARLVEAIESGALKPLVAATSPLKELRRAQEDFVSKGFVGKLVVILAPAGHRRVDTTDQSRCLRRCSTRCARSRPMARASGSRCAPSTIAP